MAGTHKSGFTLLELAVVLTIVALLIGGVLMGQSLLRQSRIMSIMTDVSHFKATVDMFRTQYGTLPGDMSNATTYWGAAGTPTNTSACYKTQGTGTQTCDGNGNGHIDAYTNGTYSEMYRVWQHLANAGMINGTFSGVGMPLSLAGTNVPKGQIQNTGYDLWYMGTYPAMNAYWFPAQYGHVIMFGATSGGGYALSPVLSPAEAQSFDAKIDDGNPTSGKVMAVGNGAGTYMPNCSTTNDTTAQYNLTFSGSACGLIFITGF